MKIVCVDNFNREWRILCEGKPMVDMQKIIQMQEQATEAMPALVQWFASQGISSEVSMMIVSRYAAKVMTDATRNPHSLTVVTALYHCSIAYDIEEILEGK